MKIQGRDTVAPSNILLVFPREDENGEEYFIHFEAKMVTDYDVFDNLYPQPNPPVVTKKDGSEQFLVTDPEYLKAENAWGMARTRWMILESLSVTEDLEWSTVEENDPETWGNYHDELIAAGFQPIEVTKIIQAALDANVITDEKLIEAKQRFLALKVVELPQPQYQITGHNTMEFGAHVKDLESYHLMLRNIGMIVIRGLDVQFQGTMKRVNMKRIRFLKHNYKQQD